MKNETEVKEHMTDDEAMEAWRKHSPWVRVPQDLINRVCAIMNRPATTFEHLEDEVGEAPF